MVNKKDFLLSEFDEINFSADDIGSDDEDFSADDIGSDDEDFSTGDIGSDDEMGEDIEKTREDLYSEEEI
jgi:hypothetical protein